MIKDMPLELVRKATEYISSYNSFKDRKGADAEREKIYEKEFFFVKSVFEWMGYEYNDSTSKFAAAVTRAKDGKRGNKIIPVPERYGRIREYFDRLFEKDSPSHYENLSSFEKLVFTLFYASSESVTDVISISRQYSEIPLMLLTEQQWKLRGKDIKEGANAIELEFHTPPLKLYDIRQCTASREEYPSAEVYSEDVIYLVILSRVGDVKIIKDNTRPLDIDYDDTRDVMTFSRYGRTRSEIIVKVAACTSLINMTKSSVYFDRRMREMISRCASYIVLKKYGINYDYSNDGDTRSCIRILYDTIQDMYFTGLAMMDVKRSDDKSADLELMYRDVFENIFRIMKALKDEMREMDLYIHSEAEMIRKAMEEKKNENKK